jgi:hypothetical protein
VPWLVTPFAASANFHFHVEIPSLRAFAENEATVAGAAARLIRRTSTYT